MSISNNIIIPNNTIVQKIRTPNVLPHDAVHAYEETFQRELDNVVEIPLLTSTGRVRWISDFRTLNVD